MRFSALGDILFTLPALDALRRAFKDAKIDWLCEDRTAGILRGHPQLDEVIVFERAAFSKRLLKPGRWPALLGEILRYRQDLRRRRYDLILDLQGNLKSIAHLVLGLRGGYRVGYDRPLTHDLAHRFVDQRALPDPLDVHRVERVFAILHAIGVDTEGARGVLPADQEDRERAGRLLGELFPGGAPFAVVHPFTSLFGAFKRWPKERYIELGRRLIEESGLQVAVSWGPGELEEAQAIRSAIGEGAVTWTEPLPLRAYACLLGEARLFIGGDTGPLHMAGLMGVPRVAIFGPKDPSIYGPFEGDFEVVVDEDVLCRPCRLRRCGEPICVTEIGTETVYRAAVRMLASKERRA